MVSPLSSDAYCLTVSVLLAIWLARMTNVQGDCPRFCECKWRSGKESVICFNANLSRIPAHLETGTQLIDLTSNRIATVRNDEFSRAGLLNLQKVYITKCQLRTLERYSFRHLINLIELDLSHNLLANVPSQTFEFVSELRELKLNGNPIERLPNRAFQHLPQLVRLELSQCKIVSIESNAFLGLDSSLEWLKLDKNRLATVQLNSFEPLSNLHGIELHTNPWNCTCQLRPFRQWMLKGNVPFGVPPTCYQPARLSSRPWDRLDLDEFACTPQILAQQNRTSGVEGRNISMQCRTGGVPEPAVRWSIKNRVIANATTTAMAAHSRRTAYVVQNADRWSELTIYGADVQDAGVYVCTAENRAGQVEASVTLAIVRKPPPNAATNTLLSNRTLLASVVCSVSLVSLLCLTVLCAYSIKKRQFIVKNWRLQSGRHCSADPVVEENYEKIEMNNHQPESSQQHHDSSTTVVKSSVVSSSGHEVVPSNGAYRVVSQEDSNPSKPITIGDDLVHCGSVEKHWTSPEHLLLDPDDLHIPRRTLQETRGDTTMGAISTSGSSNTNQIHASTVNGNKRVQQTLLISPNANPKRRYPDVVRHSEGATPKQSQPFCTLPRKPSQRMFFGDKPFVHHRGSQSPLLNSDSRYGSSGDDDGLVSSEHTVIFTRSHQEELLNDTVPEATNSTPLLDVYRLAPDHQHHHPAPYLSNYPALQLDHFLEEYRLLQSELIRMKENCEHLIGLSEGADSAVMRTSDVHKQANSLVDLQHPFNSDQKQQTQEQQPMRNSDLGNKYLLAQSPHRYSEDNLQ